MFQQQIVWLQSKICGSNIISLRIQIIDVSYEVWMWVNQKYVTSRIAWKLYSFETKNCSYLSVTNDDRLNRQSKESYNMQCTDSEINMTISILMNHMSMNSSIIM